MTWLLVHKDKLLWKPELFNILTAKEKHNTQPHTEYMARATAATSLLLHTVYKEAEH